MPPGANGWCFCKLVTWSREQFPLHLLLPPFITLRVDKTGYKPLRIVQFCESIEVPKGDIVRWPKIIFLSDFGHRENWYIWHKHYTWNNSNFLRGYIIYYAQDLNFQAASWSHSFNKFHRQWLMKRTRLPILSPVIEMGPKRSQKNGLLPWLQRKHNAHPKYTYKWVRYFWRQRLHYNLNFKIKWATACKAES